MCVSDFPYRNHELSMSFRTTDTSYISNIPTSSRASSKSLAPGTSSRPKSGPSRHQGGINSNTRGAARGRGRGPRASGLARAKPRGTRLGL